MAVFLHPSYEILLLPLSPGSHHPHQTPSLCPFRANLVRTQTQIHQSRVIPEAFGQGLTGEIWWTPSPALLIKLWVFSVLPSFSRICQAIEPRDEWWNIISVSCTPCTCELRYIDVTSWPFRLTVRLKGGIACLIGYAWQSEKAAQLLGFPLHFVRWWDDIWRWVVTTVLSTLVAEQAIPQPCKLKLLYGTCFAAHCGVLWHLLYNQRFTFCLLAGDPTSSLNLTWWTSWKRSMASPSGSGGPQADFNNSARDSYIPLFSGAPTDYKEWRKRITLYHQKMVLSKRRGESIVGSLSGSAWRLLEDFDVSKAEQNAFTDILKLLDKHFQYDDRVALPNDFDSYFQLLRKPGQTLLNYVTEHDELHRRLERHSVALPLLKFKDGTFWEDRGLPETNGKWWCWRPRSWTRRMWSRLSILDLWTRPKGSESWAPSTSLPKQGWKRPWLLCWGGDGLLPRPEWRGLLRVWWWSWLLWRPRVACRAVWWLAGRWELRLRRRLSGWRGNWWFIGDPFSRRNLRRSLCSLYYVDARKRFSDLHLSRGFLPVVALSDPQPWSYG